MGSQQRSALFWSAALGLPVSAVTVGLLYYCRSSRGVVTSAEQRNRSATYGTFLKQEPSQSAPQAAQAAPVTTPPGPGQGHIPVMVLVGTEYGFAEEVAEKLCQALQAKLPQYWAEVVKMADHPHGLDLSQQQAVLVACSTQGDGVPPAEAREFCEWLQGAPGLEAQTPNFSVCALGDRSYTHYCACGKMLDERLQQMGASRLADRADIDKEDWPAIEAWIDSVIAALPTLKLKTAGQLGLASGSAGKSSHGTTDQAKPAWSRKRPYQAKVLALEPLTQLVDAGDRQTLRVELDLADSGLSYVPGDALGFHPSNDHQVVEDVLEAMHADGSEAMPIPSSAYSSEPSRPNKIPLRELLHSFYDLRSPKSGLLQLLLDALTGPPASPRGSSRLRGGDSARDLTNLAAGKPKAGSDAAKDQSRSSAQQDKACRLRRLLEDNKAREIYLAERHVSDILLDFGNPAGPLPWQKVLGMLRPLQPRLYSISSSMLEHEHRVQITVAAVRYSCLGRDRTGVASVQLADRLKVGETLPVYVHRNPDFRLPDSANTPIIMVGPGTGLAPFRAFIIERLAKQQPGAGKGLNTLFFGSRTRDRDYLYGDQLEAWAHEGAITLHTAFSREQAAKVYVQDRLREQGEHIWKLLEQGAYFFVCGDASGMAPAVEEALLSIFESKQVSPDEYLDELKAKNRYQRDIWFG
ncbi:hypothetical protein WJX74_002636 [Apatococcus lobatus]|uniref:Uncharacterized protein n=1 Tax=Apatococcus lobatus TaxID=904363 RepID=A0AAW1R2R2_9CHLO